MTSTSISRTTGVRVKSLDAKIRRWANAISGRTRFDRLFLVGRSSVPLCIDALKAAIAEAKRGRDPQRYREAVDCLRTAAPNEQEAQLDYAWLEGIELSNRNETHRLTAELKGYKNNLIKESVRVCSLRQSCTTPLGHKDANRIPSAT